MATGPKHALFEQFARVAQALAHAHRLALLEQAAQGERTVDALALAAGLTVANTSQHLKLLRASGLVTSRRDGKFVLYRLADEQVLELVNAVRRVAERNLAEVARIVGAYFTKRDELEPVSRVELLERLRLGLVTVIDVRPHHEFQLGHIAGALSVPLEELEAHLAEFDRSQEIVAYCRSAYCVMSFEAVSSMRKLGFLVRRLEDGFPEWRASGLPVEVA